MLPLHRLRQFLFGGAELHMSVGMCLGGKEPTETSVVPQLVGAVQVEHRWNCAGIHEPHLHVRCGHCGYQFLTRTRKAIAGRTLA